MRPRIDPGRLVVFVGALVVAAALVWLGLLLRTRGLERADQFGGVAGLVVALTGLLWQVYATVRVPRQPAPAPPHSLAGFRLLTGGRLPRVGEVDAIALGVKPAIVLEETQNPPYVAREVDKQVVEAIAKGGLVVLHGPAACGKTRTAVQALANFSDRHLYIPAQTGALTALAGIRNAIIWLDDIDRYLSGGDFDVDLLDLICPPRRGDIAVVATIRDRELAHYDAALGSDATRHQIVARPGCKVLGQARALIGMRATLSPTERAAAEKLRGDTRIDLAMNDPESGLAEFLAAGPQLWRRWQTGSGTPEGTVGAAIVSAAIDWRLAGYRASIPAATLERHYLDYLPIRLRYSPDLPTFAQGLAWAREPVLNASSCLPATATDYFVAHNYLVDRSERDRVVPDAVWRDVLRVIQPAEGLEVGIRALDQGRADVASQAFRRTIATVYDPTSPTPASGYIESITPELYGLLGEEEAELWLGPAAQAGNPEAAFEVGRRHYINGRLTLAADWWKRAAAGQSWDAVHGLGLLQLQAGQTEDAIELWRSAADAGQVDALYNLGVMMRDAGENDEALWLWRRGARAGSVHAMHALGCWEHRHGREAQSADWWRRAALLLHAPSAYNLGVLLAARGDLNAAQVWWLEAADTGSGDAMLGMCWLKHRHRDNTAAIEWCQRALAAGHPEAAARLHLIPRQH